MTGKKLLLGVVLLLVVSLVLGGIAGCCPAGDGATPTPTAPATTPTAPAETPTAPAPGGVSLPKTGDMWTYKVTYVQAALGTLESTFTATVSSASAAGFEINIAFAETLRKEKVSGLNLETRFIPPMTRSFNGDADELEMATTIDPSGFGENAFGSVSVYTYPSPKFPLAVGNEWTRTFDYHVGTLLTKTDNHTIKVEAEESVTVPAGTFDCYKIVTYKGSDVVLTEWFAAEAKAPVKRMENLFWSGDETWELQSYSVAP